MGVGIWVLGDQLNVDQSALAGLDPDQARVLLLESTSVLLQRHYHRQKLVLVWSAMRHFAEELREKGWNVDYVQCNRFGDGLREWIAAERIAELRLMEPADRGFRAAIEALKLPVPVRWIPSNAFLWRREDFAGWAAGYKQLRLELFYREGRRRFHVLMGRGLKHSHWAGNGISTQTTARHRPRGSADPNPFGFSRMRSPKRSSPKWSSWIRNGAVLGCQRYQAH